MIGIAHVVRPDRPVIETIESGRTRNRILFLLVSLMRDWIRWIQKHATAESRLVSDWRVVEKNISPFPFSYRNLNNRTWDPLRPFVCLNHIRPSV